MNDDPRLDATPPPGTKKPWHTPAVEEVDYSETQATPGPGPIYDGTVYDS
ncbi:MAG TPA: hypothetical protein VHF89_16815 [Solirubrobacteraceae bacterium]|nr:hypothetical protein [Solirubrobacteraceae bacterium]